MTKSQQSIDVEAIADRARVLWGRAVEQATTARVELFAKVSVRYRATRELDGVGVTFDRAHESGLAVRAFRHGRDRAGFAAASGFSADVVRWVVDTACSDRAQASASTPGSADSVAAERWDLDEASALPGEEVLTAALCARPHLESIEVGTTIEVLVGAEGWLAARRRHRAWALGGVAGARLVARRGFQGWEEMLDAANDPGMRSPISPPGDPGALIVTPEAAAPLVAALVGAFHGGDSVGPKACGEGWSVADDPVRPDGLAGGTFDDAGFPAATKILAEGGFWVGRLAGPGTYRRSSFREPPLEGATNLVMASGEGVADPAQAILARRCRVLRQSPELWVLELQLADESDTAVADRRWVRVRPEALLEGCACRLGPPRVTAAGPIVPTLMFEGLTAR